MMNIACSTCLELFTTECDVSTTPCGHVFHTGCITRWLNENPDCFQCHKTCKIGQIIKLFFTENQCAIEEQIAILDLKVKSLELEEKSSIFDTLLIKKSNEVIRANQKCEKLEKEILQMRMDWSKMKRNGLGKGLDPDDPPI